MAHPATPPDSAALLTAMRALHAAIERIEVHAAQGLNLARSDVKCLDLLAAGALTPRAIGAGLALTSGSVTALVDRLERRGLVVRGPDPDDRRGVLVQANAAALAQLARVRAPLEGSLVRLAARYGAGRTGEAARQVADLARLCDWAAARIADPGG